MTQKSVKAYKNSKRKRISCRQEILDIIETRDCDLDYLRKNINRPHQTITPRLTYLMDEGLITVNAEGLYTKTLPRFVNQVKERRMLEAHEKWMRTGAKRGYFKTMKSPLQKMHDFLCAELESKESHQDYPHIENAILKCEELIKEYGG